MTSPEKEIENKIFSTFAEVARAIGYSPLHGKLIGVLLVKGRAVSLQELAKKTGYSAGMVSLSLDLLEVLGVVKKVKKEGDRQLYISLAGDLLECLKNAITIKVEKSIKESLIDFESAKTQLAKMNGQDAENAKKTLEVLESELNRLHKYISLLSEIRLP